jgi:hypothetical protein
MFNRIVFDKEIDDLVLAGRNNEAEERMLKMYAELNTTGSAKEEEHVAYRLAHFYSTPGSENLEKAESFFLRREALSPGAYTKWQTATFYFYVLADFQKTIGKIAEIEPSEADQSSYYSALALNGQALIKLGLLMETEKVIAEMFTMIRSNPQGLPFGDEINLLEAAISMPVLTRRCRDILELITPKIRSHEYQKRARALLKLSE